MAILSLENSDSLASNTQTKVEILQIEPAQTTKEGTLKGQEKETVKEGSSLVDTGEIPLPIDSARPSTPEEKYEKSAANLEESLHIENKVLHESEMQKKSNDDKAEFDTHEAESTFAKETSTSLIEVTKTNLEEKGSADEIGPIPSEIERKSNISSETNLKVDEFERKELNVSQIISKDETENKTLDAEELIDNTSKKLISKKNTVEKVPVKVEPDKILEKEIKEGLTMDDTKETTKEETSKVDETELKKADIVESLETKSIDKVDSTESVGSLNGMKEKTNTVTDEEDIIGNKIEDKKSVDSMSDEKLEKMQNPTSKVQGTQEVRSKVLKEEVKSTMDDDIKDMSSTCSEGIVQETAVEDVHTMKTGEKSFESKSTSKGKIENLSTPTTEQIIENKETEPYLISQEEKQIKEVKDADESEGKEPIIENAVVNIEPTEDSSCKTFNLEDKEKISNAVLSEMDVKKQGSSQSEGVEKSIIAEPKKCEEMSIDEKDIDTLIVGLQKVDNEKEITSEENADIDKEQTLKAAVQETQYSQEIDIVTKQETKDGKKYEATESNAEKEDAESTPDENLEFYSQKPQVIKDYSDSILDLQERKETVGESSPNEEEESCSPEKAEQKEDEDSKQELSVSTTTVEPAKDNSFKETQESPINQETVLDSTSEDD